MGATELVKMLRLAPSNAKLWVKPWRASLAVEQWTTVGPPQSPMADDTFTILPQPCSRITFQAALVHLQAPSTCTLKVQLQSACDILLNPLAFTIPALLTRISMRPYSFIAVWTILSPSSTEWQSATALPPICLIYQTTASATAGEKPPPTTAPPRSFTTTLAPLDAKNTASSFPRPLPAPVITATLPSYLSDITYNYIHSCSWKTQQRNQGTGEVGLASRSQSIGVTAKNQQKENNESQRQAKNRKGSSKLSE